MTATGIFRSVYQSQTGPFESAIDLSARFKGYRRNSHPQTASRAKGTKIRSAHVPKPREE